MKGKDTMKKMFKNNSWRKVCTLALALMMLLTILPMAAMAAGDTVVYLDPTADWKQGDARFAVYCFTEGGGNTWVSMTADGDYYKATIPAGYETIIFCRMNPANSDNDWGNKWNQTGNLTVPTGEKNCFSIPYGKWDNADDTNWYVKGQEPNNDVQSGPVEYYVAGMSALCGSNWVENDAANKMTKNASGLYEKSYAAVPAGSYEFKVTNGTWADSVGGDGPGGNYLLVLEKNSDIKILFDATAKSITVNVTPLNTEVPTYTVTLHFMPPAVSWGETINAWIWAGNASIAGYEEYHEAWPGKAVEPDAENPGWYTVEVTTTLSTGFSFIFSGAEGKQTADLSTGALTGDVELWYYGNESYTSKPATVPKTGENTPIALLVSLMAVSGAAFVLLKKKEF